MIKIMVEVHKRFSSIMWSSCTHGIKRNNSTRWIQDQQWFI